MKLIENLVSWSVRAAPTIQYLPCTLIPFAVRRLIEVAAEKCPVQVYFVIDQLIRDSWFIELIAYFVNATNVKFSRQIVVHLVSSNGQYTKDIEELNRVLSCGEILDPNQAIPWPWCWYCDFTLPFEDQIFTVLLQSKDPVISEMYYSTKNRGKMTFVDMWYPEEKSDISLDCFNGVTLTAQFPLHISKGLSDILRRGVIFVKMAGLYSSTFFILQENPVTKVWCCHGMNESRYRNKCDSKIELTIPKISAGQISDEMFNDENFDFSGLPRMTDQPASPTFTPIDISNSIKIENEKIKLKNQQSTELTQKIATPMPDICFFSPNRILKNSKKFEDKLNEALEKQDATIAKKNLFRYFLPYI